MASTNYQLYTNIQSYLQNLEQSYNQIDPARIIQLEFLTNYIQNQIKQGHPAQLVYICTHNSRRSHFGQVWAQVAAAYYQIPQVQSYSGGTEATAFNVNAIQALQRIGFNITAANALQTNPRYEVRFSDQFPAIACFSKVFADAENPSQNFCAIMTCSDADEKCPFVPGAIRRIATPYEDPKAFDNTPQQNEMYDARCKQIALETLYAFSKVTK